MSEKKLNPEIRSADNLFVVNKRTTSPGHEGRIDFYIGRGSVLGNEFTHIPEGTQAKHVVPTREEAIRQNMLALIDKITSREKPVLNELKKLYTLSENRAVNLVCYCAPKSCHGDNIKTLISRSELVNGELKFRGLEELKEQFKGISSGEQNKSTSVRREVVEPKDKQLDTNESKSTADELRAKNKIILSRRDSVVINDRSSEKGFRIIKVDELKKHKFKLPIFVGTGSECKTWLDASPEKRKEIEEQSLKRLHDKLEVNNHALDISKPGEQADLFAGNRYSLPKVEASVPEASVAEKLKDDLNGFETEHQQNDVKQSQGISML